MNIKRRSLVVGAVVLLLFAAAVFKYADVFANIAAIFVYVLLFLLVLTRCAGALKTQVFRLRQLQR